MTSTTTQARRTTGAAPADTVGWGTLLVVLTALGVAVTGVVFYQALGTVTHAFTASLTLLTAFTEATAIIAQFLPASAREPAA